MRRPQVRILPCQPFPFDPFLYAEMPSGHSLAYCAHHGTEYIDALIAQHATIVDLRHMVCS